MRSEGNYRKRVRKYTLWAGVGLIVVGLGFMARIPLTYLKVAWTEKTMINKPLVPLQTKNMKPIQGILVHQNALYPQVVSDSLQPPTGSMLGHLMISKLNINAPIVQGTSLNILADSAGHLSTSVLPGEIGTTVIAAHDVTYFHHINELKPGDILTVETAQGTFEYRVQSHKIIHVGTNVVNTPYPSLVLETCYPLNALTLVDRRYIVTATLSKSIIKTST